MDNPLRFSPRWGLVLPLIISHSSFGFNWQEIEGLSNQLSTSKKFILSLPKEQIRITQTTKINKCQLQLSYSTLNGVIYRDWHDLSQTNIFSHHRYFKGRPALYLDQKSYENGRPGILSQNQESFKKDFKKWSELERLCKKPQVQKKWRPIPISQRTSSFKKGLPDCSSSTCGKIIERPGEMTLLGSRKSFQLRLKMIKKAKRNISLQALVLKADDFGKYVAKELIKKREEGLDIRIIVDGMANFLANPLSKAEWHNTYIMYNNLMANGIRVFGYSCGKDSFRNEIQGRDYWKLIRRHHEKLWIIDGDTFEGEAIVGGRNFSFEYFSELNGKFDLDIFTRGKIVSEIYYSFLRSWDNKKIRFKSYSKDPSCFNPYHPIKERTKFLDFKNSKVKFFKKLNSKERRESAKNLKEIHNYLKNEKEDLSSLRYIVPQSARFIHSRPDEKENYIFEAYLDTIKNAKEEILLSHAYFVPHPKLRQELVKALGRGVKVSLMSNHPNTNKSLSLMNIVGRYHYLELYRAGEIFSNPVSLLEWEGPKGENKKNRPLHGKWMVVDGKVGVIGSFNLNHSSLKNTESVLIFSSSILGEKMRELFIGLKNYSYSPSLKDLRYYKKPRGKDWVKLKIGLKIENYL